MKYRKSKESIRNQILKKLWFVRNKRGIIFFDTPDNIYQEDIKLDPNDIEVLLMEINRSKKILVTTKYIFIIDKQSTFRIKGDEIDRLDYMEFVNGQKTIEEKSRLKIMHLRFKMNRRIGHYRIVKKDGSFEEIKIKRTKFADCLNDSVKKLKFVANKYEGF